MKLECSLTPYTKKLKKWIKDLNVRLGTIKLLEENQQNKHINRRESFLDLSPRVMAIKINRTKIKKKKGPN